MSYLAFSDSFEYLCYGSTAIINIFTFTDFDDDSRAVRVNIVNRDILTLTTLKVCCIINQQTKGVLSI